jgi:hypothetical protein
MKRRAITGMYMNRSTLQRVLHQLKVEEQLILQQELEDQKVRERSLTINQLSALLKEEGIELVGGRIYVPLAWVAVTRRPTIRSSLALIPRAR